MNPRRPPLWKSPWLWIGASCGVLALGVGIFLLFALVPLIGHYKPGGTRDRIRNEPNLLFAELSARKDPNVEVVSRDTRLHTVTLRNQKTGESFVLEQKDGNQLRIRTEAGEVLLGIARFQSNWALHLGSGAGPLPSWMPLLPEAKPRPLYSLDTGEVVSGVSVVVPSGPVGDAYAFYRGELERKGFKLVPGDLLSASSPDFTSSLLVTDTQSGGRPGLMLTWSRMAGNP